MFAIIITVIITFVLTAAYANSKLNALNEYRTRAFNQMVEEKDEEISRLKIELAHAELQKEYFSKLSDFNYELGKRQAVLNLATCYFDKEGYSKIIENIAYMFGGSLGAVGLEEVKDNLYTSDLESAESELKQALSNYDGDHYLANHIEGYTATSLINYADKCVKNIKEKCFEIHGMIF